ncbi:MAG: peptidylprolyl isomerase [Deltaproteobacteria bacterium]
MKFVNIIVNHGGSIMGCRKNICLILAVLCLLLFSIIGCGSKEEKKAGITSDQEQPVAQQVAPQAGVPATPSADAPTGAAAVVIDVDGSKLTQGNLDSEIRKKMAAIKGQVPKAQMEKAKNEMRKQIINDFTVRTILANEVSRVKITAGEQEVSEAVERLKSSLPQGMTMEDLMKKNKITKEMMYEEIRFGIKINKLVLSQKASKAKPTEKEISKFYQKNKDKFTVPESVHVRHILIAKAAGDDDKKVAEKKSKAETLRKQIIAGADFAEVAKNNSDCPSKNNGGDLGIFSRGEMVKPFESAAFAQEKNAIGPVVETNYGYHIIQVLEHLSPKTMSLDETTKAKITAFLQQQKQQETFEDLVKKLRAKANIVVYQN